MMMTGFMVIGTFFMLAGIGMFAVSLETNYWLSTKAFQIRVGLYEYCTQYQCMDIEESHQPMDAVRAVRGLVISGITFGSLSFLIATIYLVFKIRMDQILNKLPRVCLVFSSMACISGIAGASVYGVQLRTTKTFLVDYHTHLSTSFILCVGGAFLMGMGGILGVFVGRSEASTDSGRLQ